MSKKATIEATDLMVCPFCGSEAKMQPWHGGGPEKVHIGCSSDYCKVMPGCTGETPNEAQAVWNRRVGRRTAV